MRGAGFLAIWSDIAPNNLTDYRHWLTREHTTERVTTKGFLGSRVFRAARADIHRFFILYELEAAEVLDGPRLPCAPQCTDAMVATYHAADR